MQIIYVIKSARIALEISKGRHSSLVVHHHLQLQIHLLKRGLSNLHFKVIILYNACYEMSFNPIAALNIRMIKNILFQLFDSPK